jgi:hypothetical protein
MVSTYRFIKDIVAQVLLINVPIKKLGDVGIYKHTNIDDQCIVTALKERQ